MERTRRDRQRLLLAWPDWGRPRGRDRSVPVVRVAPARHRDDDAAGRCICPDRGHPFEGHALRRPARTAQRPAASWWQPTVVRSLDTACSGPAGAKQLVAADQECERARLRAPAQAPLVALRRSAVFGNSDRAVPRRTWSHGVSLNRSSSSRLTIDRDVDSPAAA